MLSFLKRHPYGQKLKYTTCKKLNIGNTGKKDNLIHLLSNESDVASTYVQATVFFSEPDSSQREDM